MTKKRKLPSPRLLRRLLDYDPETGELRWKKRPAWMFKKHSRHGTRSSSAGAWNGKFAGKLTFSRPNLLGYTSGSIFERTYTGHRIAWAIVRGEWPKQQIDHINGDRTDNRLENLREVSNQENARNKRLLASNTSGVTGVSWLADRQKWIAQIKVNYKCLRLGYFDSFDDAVAARHAADIKYEFHPNHGRD